MTEEVVHADVRPRRREGVRVRRASGRVVLILGSDVYELNETAEATWMLCNGNNTITEIAAQIADEYDAEIDQIKEDVTELLEELSGLGVISLA
jgi:hypothetical protein